MPSTDELRKAIKENDHESLAKWITDKSFRIGDTISPNNRELPNNFNCKLYFPQIAALYGSYECFDLLLAGGAPKNSYSSSPNLLHCAIAGGNPKIFNYVMKELKPDIAELGFTALRFRRNNMFVWILQHLITDTQVKTKGDEYTYLHVAAMSDNAQAIMFLIQCGLDPNQKDRQGYTPLMRAVMENKLDAVRALITTQQVKVNLTNGSYGSALHIAIDKKNAEAVKLLLFREDTDPNLRNSNGETPLFKAVNDQNEEIVNYLARDSRVKPFVGNRSGVKPLHIAAAKNSFSIFSVVQTIDGTDINMKDDSFNTPLIIAIKNKKIDMVKVLLMNPDIDVNARNKDSATALHFAAESDNRDILGELLKRSDIKVNPKNNNLETPLIIAARQRRPYHVKALCGHPKIDVNARDNKRMTALHYACDDGNFEMYEFLMKVPGIRINRKNNNRETPLHLAVKQKCEKIVTSLALMDGVKINAQDNTGDTVLHVAARRCFPQGAKAILCNPELDHSILNKSGSSALLTSFSCSNNQEITEMYIKTGQFDMNLHDNENENILHYAAKDIRNMRLVDKYKMPFDARGVNTSGKTPMDVANNNDVKTIISHFEIIYDQFLVLKAKQVAMGG